MLLVLENIMSGEGSNRSITLSSEKFNKLSNNKALL
jgi:hypothetical protein